MLTPAAQSKDTLTKLQISRPTVMLSRWGLASLFLNFSANLTTLILDCPATWHPKPKPTTRLAFPFKRKDYKVGDPQNKDVSRVAPLPSERRADLSPHTQLDAIAKYTYFLDALAPYLPKLVTIAWTGPIASTSVFSFFPGCLKTISWSRSPDIKPGALAKLLRKSVTRTRNGQQVLTIVSKGLQCVSITVRYLSPPSHPRPHALKLLPPRTQNDDLTWSETDLEALEAAAWERGMCLHLTGGAQADLGGAFGGFGIPFVAPGVGGAGGGGAQGGAGLFGGLGAGLFGGGGGPPPPNNPAPNAGVGMGPGAGAGAGTAAGRTTTTTTTAAGAGRPAPTGNGAQTAGGGGTTPNPNPNPFATTAPRTPATTMAGPPPPPARPPPAGGVPLRFGGAVGLGVLPVRLPFPFGTAPGAGV